MATFTKIALLGDVVPERVDCSYVVTKEYNRGTAPCEHPSFPLLPETDHCVRHLTEQEMATLLPRLKAWRDGLAALYGAVVTLPEVKLPDITVSVGAEVT